MIAIVPAVIATAWYGSAGASALLYQAVAMTAGTIAIMRSGTPASPGTA